MRNNVLMLCFFIMLSQFGLANEAIERREYEKICNNIISMNKDERINYFNNRDIFDFWANPERTESKFIVDNHDLIVSHRKDGFRTIFAILYYHTDNEVYYLCEYDNKSGLSLKSVYDVGEKKFSSQYKDSFVYDYKKERFSLEPGILLEQIESLNNDIISLMDSPRYDKIIEEISTGEDEWLDVAVALWPHAFRRFSSISWMSDLEGALAESLDVRPVETLKALKKLNSSGAIKKVCTDGHPDLLERRLYHVKQVKDENLKTITSKCSGYISEKIQRLNNNKARKE